MKPHLKNWQRPSSRANFISDLKVRRKKDQLPAAFDSLSDVEPLHPRKSNIRNSDVKHFVGRKKTSPENERNDDLCPVRGDVVDDQQRQGSHRRQQLLNKRTFEKGYSGNNAISL